MEINVIGLGYIGLPTALMLASSGHKIVGTDFNKKLVASLQNGRIPFEEIGIEELYSEAIKKEIIFTSEYIKSSMYIITVPTPYIKASKKIDPSYIISAVKSVMEICDKGAVVAIESTVSPGTIDAFVRPIIQDKGFVLGEDIHLVHAPERILPGNMIYELRHNSRTIGADSVEVGEKVKAIYESFCESEIVITDIRTAEMTKVVENTFRDINIAFANELTKICRSDDLDVYEIIRIANKHPRVNILNPGPGVGGHCISVDPWFLVGDYPGLTNLILTARHTNDSMPEFVLERVNTIMKEKGMTDLSRVGIYGLTYKQDVDDVRESPSLQLLEKMKEHLSSGLKVYDPMIDTIIIDNQYTNFEEFLSEVDLVIVMVSHTHILNNEEKLAGKIILDTQKVLKNSIVNYL
ncbi:nucleotide sugar dehydrogenase [Carnobacterium sp. TMP28]|uniref:nucleotide sugar dehydrogenase n=1 Tax=Carnobacterium sp. TMP28 TaxID=3397060 RepID=UPI0039E12971